ncbi:hypothetical protein E6O75_ATG03712 [Venturia nashicola]|uniref:Uncharacterized protein n=1 Tax=Venturia nashicola TaxID=86259 RepID=A0A4Z1PEF5_9PEZI|nr:hypothetical protein E6O75_ATG03712 [Venturia nashicola]
MKSSFPQLEKINGQDIAWYCLRAVEAYQAQVRFSAAISGLVTSKLNGPLSPKPPPPSPTSLLPLLAMRRSTRKALRHVLLFLLTISLVIYLTSPTTPRSTKTFPWAKVQYITTSTSLPPARGKCPHLTSMSKPALVVASVEADDKDWLTPLSKKYHTCIYTADGPLNPKSGFLQIPKNKGNEAMAYLTFIIDNYSSIPRAGVVFIHGSRFAWHNDHARYDNLALLRDLNLERAVGEGSGYHNLRCDWSLSTCPTDVKAQGSLENKVQAVLVPYDNRAVSDSLLPKALGRIFGNGVVKMASSDVLKSQCCAQFVVSRESILQHEKEEYVALRQWLLDEGSGAAPANNKYAGRILSYVWHILFLSREKVGVPGEGLSLESLNREACPSAEECYCRIYGRCGLEGCKKGSCRGQYSLPKNLKVPENQRETGS